MTDGLLHTLVRRMIRSEVRQEATDGRMRSYRQTGSDRRTYALVQTDRKDKSYMLLTETDRRMQESRVRDIYRTYNGIKVMTRASHEGDI